MPGYCVNRNAQTNGDHEVHDVRANKSCLPTLSNRQDLGYSLIPLLGGPSR